MMKVTATVITGELNDPEGFDLLSGVYIYSEGTLRCEALTRSWTQENGWKYGRPILRGKKWSMG